MNTPVPKTPPSRGEIVAAYRIFLGRDPDPSGLEDHIEAAAKGNLAVADLFDLFTRSEEFQKEYGKIKLIKEADDVQFRTVDVGGVMAVVDANEPEFGRAVARDRTWEPHLLHLLASQLKPADVFIDVGANVGIMAFHAAKAVGPSGKVIAFEPNPDNARNFLWGTLKNGFQGRVKLFPFALSDREDLFALAGGSNTHIVEAEGLGRLTQAMRGDDLLANESRVDFIKLDIEGHEPFALSGLELTLRRHKPMVLCVFNPRCLKDHIGVPPREFADQIFSLTDSVEAIEYDGRRNTVTDPAQLIALWAARNVSAVETGLLPDGMLHFDLLFSVRI